MTAEAPSVQRLGHAVLVQGAALADLRHLAILGAWVRKQRDGVSVSPATRVLLEALAQATPPPPPEPAPPTWSPLDQIGSREAATILGMSPRQAQRLAAVIGGRRIGRGLVYDRGAVEAYAAQRRANQEEA